MNRDITASRRNFLRGLGACLTLPALEAVAPSRILAAGAPAGGLTASGSPLRMAFVYIPNGVNVPQWRPEGEGGDFRFGATMEPLEALRSKLQVVSGLAHQHAFAGPDGAGDHARANATFLTGARAKKTAGSDIRVGVSVDQIAAQQIGDATRLASLELSCDGVRKSGACDSGYSCAYQFNVSWRSESTPMPPESNPRLVFERLFGSGSPEERQRNYRLRQASKRSILDFVLEDTRQLNRQLGRNDQRKLDEYLTGVREIEKRIEKAERFDLPDPGVDSPEGIPGEYRDHIRLMFDLLALAFQTDSTRISTFMMAHDGSNRSFADIGVPEGHHYLSHHQSNEEKLEKIARIDRFYVEQFGYFLNKLESMKESDGRSVLDNSMIVYGGGISDGNRHNHDDLPIILAGGGGGTLSPGRHLRLPDDVPMTNLYLSMLERMGVEAEQVGDSTGKLENV